MSKFRVGHDFLVGKTTLRKMTIVDIFSTDEMFQVYDQERQCISTLDLSHVKDIYGHLTNGITCAETQDIEGRFTVEGDEECIHFPKAENGTKVKFNANFKDALIEIQGYVVRNFWEDYYLISEVGVSVPNRYWKVGHSRVVLS